MEGLRGLASQQAARGRVAGDRMGDMPFDDRLPVRLREIYIYADLAAEYKGVHVTTIIRHIRKGALQGDLLGQRWAVVRSSLEDWTPDEPGNPNWKS